MKDKCRLLCHKTNKASLNGFLWINWYVNVQAEVLLFSWVHDTSKENVNHFATYWSKYATFHYIFEAYFTQSRITKSTKTLEFANFYIVRTVACRSVPDLWPACLSGTWSWVYNIPPVASTPFLVSGEQTCVDLSFLSIVWVMVKEAARYSIGCHLRRSRVERQDRQPQLFGPFFVEDE